MDKIKARTGIYHEHQQGFLCGQHALNNLLQNPFFSPDTLGDIARDLDIEEISVLEHTPFQFENSNDTGFYNIQVLQRALKTFEIELVSYTSQDPIAKQARSNPESISGYICNLGLHWFTIRRIGRHYFNLNSYYYVPELISEITLTTCLNFIKEKGYSVFIVCGTLPACLADEKLTANPIGPAEYRLLTKDLPKLIMDPNTQYRDKNENSAVTVPSSLYYELQKNPNDPDIRKKFNQYLPSGVTIDDLANFSDPFIRKTDGIQPTRRCNCPDHRHQPQTFTESSIPYMFDDKFIDNSTKLQQPSRIITQHVTEYIIDETNLDSQNKSHQHSFITSQYIVMSQPPITNNESIANHDIQRMTQIKVALEKEKELLRLAMYQSMVNEIEMNDDELFSYEGSAEKLNQQLLDRAIAASLITDTTANKPSEVSSELIPLPAKNSEQISTQKLSLSSSKSTNSLPFTNTPSRLSENENSTQPMIIYSSTPTDVHSLPLKDANSTSLTYIPSLPPKNTRSAQSTTIYSSPSIDTHSFSPEVVEMPSVEELRKRRLQHYGNRDRSIISQASNSYD